jgi:hypothetical protein
MGGWLGPRPRAILMSWRREKSLALTGIQTLDCLGCSIVALPGSPGSLEFCVRRNNHTSTFTNISYCIKKSILFFSFVRGSKICILSHVRYTTRGNCQLFTQYSFVLEFHADYINVTCLQIAWYSTGILFRMYTPVSSQNVSCDS